MCWRLLRLDHDRRGGEAANIPAGIAAFADNSFVFADSGRNRLRLVTATGAFGTAIGSSGDADGLFSDPRDVAVGPGAGDIFVADGGNNRNQRFNSSGQFITKWGGFGSGVNQFVNQFNDPRGIAVNTNGTVIVANTNAHEINRFSETGFFLSEFGRRGSGQGEFATPNGVATDAQRNIYVADTGNNRIQVSTSSGTFIREWGRRGSGNGEFSNPIGIAISADETVFVTDLDNDRVQQFSKTGKFQQAFGREGNGAGEFRLPFGIAVNRVGTLIVSDFQNNQLHVFDPAQPRAVPPAPQSRGEPPGVRRQDECRRSPAPASLSF